MSEEALGVVALASMLWVLALATVGFVYAIVTDILDRRGR